MSLASLSNVGNIQPTSSKALGPQLKEKQIGGDSFKNTFDQVLNKTNSLSDKGQFTSSALKFSNHAVERMKLRGVNFAPEQMGKIEDAINKASVKGAKNTLVVTEDSALIVSVDNKTVVTVMDKSNLKENVFTNIDSTVIV